MTEFPVPENKFGIIKSVIHKLVDYYDISEQYENRIEFHGVVMNSIIDSDINFLFGDRIIAWYTDDGVKFEIFRTKDCEPIVYNIKENNNE